MTPARSSKAGSKASGPVETRRLLAVELGEKSSTKGNGEPDRLTGPLGLWTPGIRFPYSSRLVFCPGSGGAPSPKLPRGIGTPPLDSNFAILERRLPTPPLAGDEDLDPGADWCDCCWPCWGAETLRCWRAAIRSFKLPTGGACTLDLAV